MLGMRMVVVQRCRGTSIFLLLLRCLWINCPPGWPGRRYPPPGGGSSGPPGGPLPGPPGPIVSGGGGGGPGLQSGSYSPPGPYFDP
jgi:hypothetical protein